MLNQTCCQVVNLPSIICEIFDEGTEVASSECHRHPEEDSSLLLRSQRVPAYSQLLALAANGIYVMFIFRHGRFKDNRYYVVFIS
jgi:hypothetical protein